MLRTWRSPSSSLRRRRRRAGPRWQRRRAALLPRRPACSGRPETPGPDAAGVVAERDEGARGCLDERGRATDVGERALARPPRHLLEQLRVDAPAVAAPALRLGAGQ